jgi:hypothetical protein
MGVKQMKTSLVLSGVVPLVQEVSKGKFEEVVELQFVGHIKKEELVDLMKNLPNWQLSVDI